jgi:hypothetical protein
MGLLVRFPLERARAVPPAASAGESASIVVLPVIRIERVVNSQEAQAKPRAKSGGRPRRRTKRPA